MIRSRLLYSVLGGVVALGLLAGAAVTFAQSDTTPEATVPEAATPEASAVPADSDGRTERDQYLADALGIDLEALQTAQETARIAMIDQAVADGRLTEEEAAELKLSSGRGRRLNAYYDEDEFLADALGISVEELEAAELEAYEVELAARVAAGELTQEEADLKLAEKVARTYLDTDAINAQVQAALEAAVADALADGAITQAQADALLAQIEANPYNFSGGFGGQGHGHGGHGGHGGMRGSGSIPTPDSAPDTSSDTTTDTSFDA